AVDDACDVRQLAHGLTVGQPTGVGEHDGHEGQNNKDDALPHDSSQGVAIIPRRPDGMKPVRRCRATLRVMKRCAPRISAGIALLLLLSLVSPAAAIEEADRLWLVGERAFADGLYPASRRALERFINQYPKDT